jgi:hypothetical protein
MKNKIVGLPLPLKKVPIIVKVFTFDKKSNNFWCQEGRHVTN